MSLYQYSTTKSAQNTIAEIQELLAPYDVSGILTEMEGRAISSVSFRMRYAGQDFAFRLPCNWRGVYEIIKNDKKITGKFKSEEQAIRVAWRLIFRWIQSQLALVEVNMVTIPQVFLPYTIMSDNRTLSEHVAENPKMLLN